MADDGKNSGQKAPVKTRPCPICRKPSLAPWRPFCSKRCADVDLGRWLGEVYRVPVRGEEGNGGEAEDGDGEPQAAGDDDPGPGRGDWTGSGDP
jgi:hypothetical protein